jgi:hypothetical protein
MKSLASMPIAVTELSLMPKNLTVAPFDERISCLREICWRPVHDPVAAKFRNDVTGLELEDANVLVISGQHEQLRFAIHFDAICKITRRTTRELVQDRKPKLTEPPRLGDCREMYVAEHELRTISVAWFPGNAQCHPEQRLTEALGAQETMQLPMVSLDDGK